jgi:hypothetical protein
MPPYSLSRVRNFHINLIKSEKRKKYIYLLFHIKSFRRLSFNPFKGMFGYTKTPRLKWIELK